jgi:DNA-binding NarL/FixJ family response regulator
MMENDQTAVIKTIIIEDHRELREGLQTLINFTDGFKCTGAFRTAEEGISRAKNEPPDVVLTDIGLPGIDGIEGIRRLKEMYPNLIILVLTIHDDNERIFDALCAGACGYLLKRTPPTKLLENIREAVTGGAPMSPEVARRVITIFKDYRPPEKVDYDLTAHETRILKLLVDGYNFTTAAKKLGVSYNTVKFHMTRIYDKLQVHSKTDAVAKALQNRLLD